MKLKAVSRGHWKYDAKDLTLTTEAGGYPYEIDLESITTSVEMLDWIMQIAKKKWGTSSVVGELVLILNEIHRPQETLCSMGIERGPIAVKNIIRSSL
jgi:hypothetical protein